MVPVISIKLRLINMYFEDPLSIFLSRLDEKRVFGFRRAPTGPEAF